MQISETTKTHHELICIHYKAIDDKTHEKWVDILKNDDGDLISVSIGHKEITDFDLEILAFLKKEGKI